MQTKYIDVDDGKWGIIVIYDFNLLDFDELSAIMQTFGMSLRSASKSLRVLSQPNSGMAVSKLDIRMSAIFVSKPTSNAEFWNTLAHEIHHVANTIIEYYGETYFGEPSAYLHGYLFQKVVEQIAEPCF